MKTHWIAVLLLALFAFGCKGPEEAPTQSYELSDEEKQRIEQSDTQGGTLDGLEGSVEAM
jgi:PBP1b-binding outer membrane lipoprotein LpoB